MRRTSWIDQRIIDGVAMRWFLLWFGVYRFLAAADWRDGGSPSSLARGEHDQGNVAMPPMPGSALVVIESELVFHDYQKLSSIAHRWPSTAATSVSMDVPAGHQVVKKARSPSAI